EVSGDGATTVYDKFTGQPIAHFANAGRSQVAQAVAAAAAAFKAHPLTPYDRHTTLLRTAEPVQQHAAELLDSIVAESGFTVSDAQTELNRSVQTLILSAEEAKRIHGEMVPLESAPNIRNRIGFTIRVPLGVVCAITPFKSPLNTVTHKVAPALAAGNSVVLKPAGATPITAARVCRLLVEAGLPHGYINLLNGSGRDIGRWLLEEEQIRFYTFTGSTEVGRTIQRGAGLRRTQLELGSISSTIVCEDANLDWAVPR